jgi:hypothetical protein
MDRTSILIVALRQISLAKDITIPTELLLFIAVSSGSTEVTGIHYSLGNYGNDKTANTVLFSLITLPSPGIWHCVVW